MNERKLEMISVKPSTYVKRCDPFCCTHKFEKNVPPQYKKGDSAMLEYRDMDDGRIIHICYRCGQSISESSDDELNKMIEVIDDLLKTSENLDIEPQLQFPQRSGMEIIAEMRDHCDHHVNGQCVVDPSTHICHICGKFCDKPSCSESCRMCDNRAKLHPHRV